MKCSFEGVDNPVVENFEQRSLEFMARNKNPITTPGLDSLEIFFIDELHTLHQGVIKNHVGFVVNTAIEKTSSKSAPRRWPHVRRCRPSVFKPRACTVPTGSRTAPRNLSAGPQPDFTDTVTMHCVLLAGRGPQSPYGLDMQGISSQ